MSWYVIAFSQMIAAESVFSLSSYYSVGQPNLCPSNLPNASPVLITAKHVKNGNICNVNGNIACCSLTGGFQVKFDTCESKVTNFVLTKFQSAAYYQIDQYYGTGQPCLGRDLVQTSFIPKASNDIVTWNGIKTSGGIQQTTFDDGTLDLQFYNGSQECQPGLTGFAHSRTHFVHLTKADFGKCLNDENEANSYIVVNLIQPPVNHCPPGTSSPSFLTPCQACTQGTFATGNAVSCQTCACDSCDVNTGACSQQVVYVTETITASPSTTSLTVTTTPTPQIQIVTVTAEPVTSIVTRILVGVPVTSSTPIAHTTLTRTKFKTLYSSLDQSSTSIPAQSTYSASVQSTTSQVVPQVQSTPSQSAQVVPPVQSSLSTDSAAAQPTSVILQVQTIPSVTSQVQSSSSDALQVQSIPAIIVQGQTPDVAFPQVAAPLNFAAVAPTDSSTLVFPTLPTYKMVGTFKDDNVPDLTIVVVLVAVVASLLAWILAHDRKMRKNESEIILTDDSTTHYETKVEAFNESNNSTPTF